MLVAALSLVALSAAALVILTITNATAGQAVAELDQRRASVPGRLDDALDVWGGDR